VFSPTPASCAICRVLVPWYPWRENSLLAASMILSVVIEVFGTIGTSCPFHWRARSVRAKVNKRL
jgi:hypothetical protein